MKCYKGNGCMFRGDLPEICRKYLKGDNNGDPIFGYDEFPDLCENCESRDGDFCYAYGDLICFKQEDPFDCKIQLPQDALNGYSLLKFTNESIKKACEKRKWYLGKQKPES